MRTGARGHRLELRLAARHENGPSAPLTYQFRKRGADASARPSDNDHGVFHGATLPPSRTRVPALITPRGGFARLARGARDVRAFSSSWSGVSMDSDHEVLAVSASCR